MHSLFSFLPRLLTCLICFFVTITLPSVAQDMSGQLPADGGTPLVLGRYASDYQRQIKQGTFLKVYKYLDGVKGNGQLNQAKGLNKINSVFTGKLRLKGQYVAVSGDSLVLAHRGSLIRMAIDEIVMIKQYHSPFLRLAGTAVNAFGLYGLTVGSALAIAGGVTLAQDNDFGVLFLFSGLVAGGLGYAVHRLGLMIRRKKFDLSGEEWYIERTVASIESGG